MRLLTLLAFAAIIAADNVPVQTTNVTHNVDISSKIKRLPVARLAHEYREVDISNEIKRLSKARPNEHQKMMRRKEQLVGAITEKYNVDETLARKIVKIANAHQQPDFPKTEDIIAIVGIESSFRPHVKSKLKTDPAVGLMQVRPGVWKIPHEELSTIEGQIKHGAGILAHYYDKVGKVEGAVMAYNVGITAYRKGKTNKRYLNKYKTEVAMYR